MKRLFLLLLLSSAALGQTNRFDSQALGPKGPLPNVIVSVCAGTASGIPCSPQIQTYTDATLSTQCLLGSPVTPAGSSTCSGTSDALGNYGFWLPAGVYKYSLTGPGITGKTYDLILPTSSGVTACSSSNIQNCINAACPGTVPGIAWLPLGSSTGVTPFTIPNNCTVKCPSPWGCKITLANGSNANFITEKTIPATNVVIEDTIIDGNQTNQSGVSSCIYMQSVVGVHLSNNIIQNCRTHAVFVDGCQTYVGANCTVPVASQNVWVEKNLISSPVNGHGILLGNGPVPSNTVVNNFHVRGNTILHTTSALVNGIFTIGAASTANCGTGIGDITNNVINGATDTGIEVGQGSCQVTVTGNSITLGTQSGTTGIGIRSAQEVTVTGNQVHSSASNTTQVCLLFWNNAGNDDLRFQNVTASNNIGKGCNGQAIGSATYTSGGSITGSSTQTCNVAFTGSGATGTVALTGTNVIAGGTTITITNGGVQTTAPTTATLSNGTATCSGTATIAATLSLTSFDFQVNLGTAGSAGIGNKLRVTNTQTDGGLLSYNYLGLPSNFFHCGNDDGICSSTEGVDFAFDPGSGQFEHFSRGMSVQPSGGALFNPAAGEMIHAQGGGTADSIVTESTVDSTQGYTMFNTAQKWNMSVRTDLAEAWAIRDRTASVDVLQIAKSTGNMLSTGTLQNTGLIQTNLLISKTAPTIAAGGCGGSAASIATQNGTGSFTINVGTAPTSAGCVVTLPTATNGWNCFVTDITTNSTSVFVQKQTAAGSSTTAATLVNYSDVAVATAPTANDIWSVSCFAR